MNYYGCGGLCGRRNGRAFARETKGRGVLVSVGPLPGNRLGQAAHSHVPLSPSSIIGPILWGHSGPLCHALSLLLALSMWTSILHCHSPGVATVARRLRYSYSWLRLMLVVVSTVATPGEWQCKIRTGGVRQ